MKKILKLWYDFRVKRKKEEFQMLEFGIIDGLMMLVSVSLIALVALQHQKQGLSDSLSGGNSELFKQQKERGAEVVIVRATYICSFLFLVLGLIIYMR